MENQINDLISMMQFFPHEARPNLLEKILAKGKKKFHLKIKKANGSFFVESQDGILYRLFYPGLFTEYSAEEISVDCLKENLENALKDLAESYHDFDKAFGNLNEVSPTDAKKIMINFFDNLSPDFDIQIIAYSFNSNLLYEVTLEKDLEEVAVFFFNGLESLEEVHLNNYNVFDSSDNDNLRTMAMDIYAVYLEKLVVELL